MHHVEPQNPKRGEGFRSCTGGLDMPTLAQTLRFPGNKFEHTNLGRLECGISRAPSLCVCLMVPGRLLQQLLVHQSFKKKRINLTMLSAL